MINKVTSLSAIALTALLISTGVLAHSGKFLTDGAGNKVLDGNGDCVLAASVVMCALHQYLHQNLLLHQSRPNVSFKT